MPPLDRNVRGDHYTIQCSGNALKGSTGVRNPPRDVEPLARNDKLKHGCSRHGSACGLEAKQGGRRA
eukprot:9830834-Lingulodinium_polyedra.AAC.1